MKSQACLCLYPASISAPKCYTINEKEHLKLFTDSLLRSLPSRMSYSPAERLWSLVFCTILVLLHVIGGVCTKLRLALSLRPQGSYIDKSFFAKWRLCCFLRGSHILLDHSGGHPADFAGHIAGVHSTNGLLAPFLARMLNAGKWQVQCRQGWHHVWLFQRLGFSVWQDLPSRDGWWLENKREVRR